MGLLLVLILSPCLAISDSAGDLAQVVQKLADTERQLPWFWSPLFEGFSDLPYTFEMTEVKSFSGRSGKTSGRETSLRLERIPLISGQYYRCLMQDGASPCSAQLVDALEQDGRKAAAFTPDQKAKVQAAGDQRRLRRRAFWSDFPQAFRFEQPALGEISFTPTGKYRSRRDPDTSLLSKITGKLRYDPATFEVTQMEYRVLADAESFTRLYKGSDFSVPDSTR